METLIKLVGFVESKREELGGMTYKRALATCQQAMGKDYLADNTLRRVLRQKGIKCKKPPVQRMGGGYGKTGTVKGTRLMAKAVRMLADDMAAELGLSQDWLETRRGYRAISLMGNSANLGEVYEALGLQDDADNDADQA